MLFCFVTWPVADWQGRHGGVWGYIVPSLKFGKICTYKRNMEPDLKVLPQRLRVRVHMICVCWLWSQVFYRYSWEITASFSGRKATAFIPWFHHRHCIPICFCGSESWQDSTLHQLGQCRPCAYFRTKVWQRRSQSCHFFMWNVRLKSCKATPAGGWLSERRCLWILSSLHFRLGLRISV